MQGDAIIPTAQLEKFGNSSFPLPAIILMMTFTVRHASVISCMTNYDERERQVTDLSRQTLLHNKEKEPPNRYYKVTSCNENVNRELMACERLQLNQQMRNIRKSGQCVKIKGKGKPADLVH